VRAFVAIPLGSGSLGGRRAPEHLTLAFLGEIPVDIVPRLEAAVGPAVAGHAAFRLGVAGVGAFPTTEHPRVVWQGVREGEGELRALARDVRQAVESAGVRLDHPEFVPHVTLFRVRSARDRDRARALLSGREGGPPPFDTRVSEVQLLESRLLPQGAVHTVRTRFPLAGIPS
jgi:RNA 2',3'-cyclic 3'-phosphodiesterase